MATTHPVQRFETLISDPRRKVGLVQCLVDRTCRCQFQPDSVTRKHVEDLVYHIDEGLDIVPSELPNHLDLIVVREYCCDQRDTLACSEGLTD